MQGKLQDESAIFSRSSDFSRAMLRWFHQHRRDLPWRVAKTATRGERPDPYHVFVSEAMLQQTQVATVVGYFQRFIQRFPTIQTLAESDEQEVLRLWQGLGYYSRARNLRKAAQQIVQEFASQIPKEVDQLLMLPGIGRYTAGAIGSIAFGRRVPILDGNVARVLCRLFAIRGDATESKARARLWRLAEDVLPARDCGDFNQSLMELGATICIPRSPSCLICPVRKFCKAFELGVQNQIPPARKSKATPLEHRWTFVIEDERGHVLIEQRPDTGRWAGMWQFVTVKAREGGVETILTSLPTKVDVSSLRKLGEVSHQLTHRRYRFEAFHITGRHQDGQNRKWVRAHELDKYPMSRPQLKIASLLLS
jgi:A/G-specific adenine glycosylase